MANSPRMGTWRGFPLVHFLCVLMVLTAGNIAAVQTEPQSTLMSTSHHGCSNLKVDPQCLRYLRRDSEASRSNKHGVHGEAPPFRSYSQISMSTFEYANYDDDNVLLPVSTDYGPSIQDTIDQKAVRNTRSTVVYVTSEVYEKKVILTSTTKPYIYWYYNAAAAGTFKSTSVVESDHFRARYKSLKNAAGIPAADIIVMQVTAFGMSGGIITPLYRCNSFGYQGTLYNHGGRFCHLRCLIEDYEDLILGAARSSQIETCEFYLIAYGKEGTLKLPGYVSGRYSTVISSYHQIYARIVSEESCDWGFLESERSTYYGQHRCPAREEHTTIRVYWIRNESSLGLQEHETVYVIIQLITTHGRCCKD